jgi:hypothetical protein
MYVHQRLRKSNFTIEHVMPASCCQTSSGWPSVSRFRVRAMTLHCGKPSFRRDEPYESQREIGSPSRPIWTEADEWEELDVQANQTWVVAAVLDVPDDALCDQDRYDRIDRDVVV